MYQFAAVIVSFLFIPLLIFLKVKLSYSLLITAGILGIISGIGLNASLLSVGNVFLNIASRTTILTVIMVSILGGLMKHYKILEKIVESMLCLIRNKKNILMIIPAMIGVLIIPGGALLSAPFINDIGKDMDLPPQRRAAINLVFRHIAMFLLPYSTSLLIISASLPVINISKLILLNSLFVISMIITGYFLFIKDIKVDLPLPRKDTGKNLLKLAVFTSPIYICVILNAITGLPFYITLIASIIIVFLLSDKKEFFKVLILSLNWSTVLTVIAVLIIKEIILRMDDLLLIFNNLFSLSSNTFSMIFIFLITSIFFGLITGNQSASLSIILPMISQLNVSIEMIHIYTYFAFVSAFIGYFFSPLHLCQAFTLQLMGVSTGELYKEYKYFAPILLLILIGSVFFLRIVI